MNSIKILAAVAAFGLFATPAMAQMTNTMGNSMGGMSSGSMDKGMMDKGMCRHHAPRQRCRVQGRHRVARPPRLERPRYLQVLQLQPQPVRHRAMRPHRPRAQHRRPPHAPRNPHRRPFDIVECHGRLNDATD